jgi:hypothetical protein
MSRRGNCYDNAVEESFFQLLKYLDANGWRHLMDESGMRSLMDATARRKWDDAIGNGDYPELSAANITATFSELHGARGDMFERGVIAVFKRLSWDYKTNQPFKFGKRIILNSLLHTYGTNNKWFHWNHRATGEIDDLVRVFSVLERKPEPDHRNSIYGKLNEAKTMGATSWEGEYFSVKWFKKGTGHLTFKRPELVEAINRILAKHYQGAIAAEKMKARGGETALGFGFRKRLACAVVRLRRPGKRNSRI